MGRLKYEESADGRGVTKRFWEAQFKQKCFYNCGSCVIKKSAIELARKSGNVDEIRSCIQKTEVCEIIVAYSTPYRFLPAFGKITFMIVSDKGHQEFFSVCKMNILSMFKNA